MIRAVVAGLVVFAASCVGIGRRDLWPPDEGRYSTVAREMAANGPGVTLRLNGELYPDKPPGFTWTVLLFSLVTGRVDETACRLPSALGAAILAGIVFHLVSRSSGGVAASVAVAVLASGFLFIWQSRYVQIDMLFAAWTALAIVAFRRGLGTEGAAPFVLGFLVLFLAVFTKGPLALVAILVLVIEAVRTHRTRRLLTRGMLLGAVLFLGLFVAWYAWAVSVEGWGYVRQTILHHTIERMESGLAHVHPWHFYLAKVPLYFLPWTPFLLLLLVPGARRALAPRERDCLGFAAVWFLTFFVIQSAFPGKRGVYLLPLYPALSMLASIPLVAVLRETDRTLRRSLATAGIAAIALVLMVAGGVVLYAGLDEGNLGRLAARIGRRDELVAMALPVLAGAPRSGAFRHDLAISGVVLLASGALVLGSTFTRYRLTAARRLGVAIAGSAAALVVLLMPWLNAHQSRRALAEDLVRIAGPSRPIGIYRHTDEGLLFYAGRNVAEVREDPQHPTSVAKFLDGGEPGTPPGVIVIREEDMGGIPSIEGRVGKDYAIRRTRTIHKKSFLIVERTGR